MRRKIIDFLKKETVLVAAAILAIISACFVPPSGAYIDYIDWRTLGILLSLMIIMEGFKQNGLFHLVGQALLKKTKKVWQLASVLIFLPFFFSMLITNDVALLTFVPFSVQILEKGNRRNLMIPIIVLQTIAANLGSMLTPIGNPQNLYIYGISGISVLEFVKTMLPYTFVSGVLLIISICFLKGKKESIIQEKQEEHALAKQNTWKNIVYFLLFVSVLLVVARIVPYWIVLIIVVIVVAVVDFRILKKVDYALLLTFIGFFIFTGNIGNLPVIKETLQNLVAGRELLFGIVFSQGISNVPAALLLSAFTENYRTLLVAVNLGGLGTLIASMASLISYKIFANYNNAQKGKYFRLFTLLNIVYLIVLVLFSFFW